jgi:hypothetical protein
VNTREELKAYDPGLAALIAEVFGDRPWRYALPTARAEQDLRHLAGYDRSRAPSFDWGPAKEKYDEVVAEKKRLRVAESAKREEPN